MSTRFLLTNCEILAQTHLFEKKNVAILQFIYLLQNGMGMNVKRYLNLYNTYNELESRLNIAKIR